VLRPAVGDQAQRVRVQPSAGGCARTNLGSFVGILMIFLGFGVAVAPIFLPILGMFLSQRRTIDGGSLL